MPLDLCLNMLCTGQISKVLFDCREGKMGPAAEVFGKVKIISQTLIDLSII